MKLTNIRGICFIDTETIGLNPIVDDVWDVGLIWCEPELVNNKTVKRREYNWQFKVNLRYAEASALAVNKYTKNWKNEDYSKPAFADEFMRITENCLWVGINPTFDIQRIERMLRENGACPLWHYRPVDITEYIAGMYGKQPPWKTSDLAKLVGVHRSEYSEDAHTALGDCRYTRDMYNAAMVAVATKEAQ